MSIICFHDEFNCRKENRSIVMETFDWRLPKFNTMKETTKRLSSSTFSWLFYKWKKFLVSRARAWHPSSLPTIHSSASKRGKRKLRKRATTHVRIELQSDREQICRKQRWHDMELYRRLSTWGEGLLGFLGNKGTLAKYRREQGNMSAFLGNSGTKLYKLKDENIASNFIKRGTNKKNVWEHGNIEQFWKGTRTLPPPGDPQKHLHFSERVIVSGVTELKSYKYGK